MKKGSKLQFKVMITLLAEYPVYNLVMDIKEGLKFHEAIKSVKVIRHRSPNLYPRKSQSSR